MIRSAFFAFGLACHSLFLVTFLYMAAFVGGLPVPKTIDSPAASVGPLPAVIIDLALLLLFAVPHSVMARPGFKRWWAGLVPAVLERSVYVLVACACVIALMAFWQPLGPTIWHLEHPAARAAAWSVFAAGWLSRP